MKPSVGLVAVCLNQVTLGQKQGILDNKFSKNERFRRMNIQREKKMAIARIIGSQILHHDSVSFLLASFTITSSCFCMVVMQRFSNCLGNRHVLEGFPQALIDALVGYGTLTLDSSIFKLLII